jgi:hypothetical protein
MRSAYVLPLALALASSLPFALPACGSDTGQAPAGLDAGDSSVGTDTNDSGYTSVTVEPASVSLKVPLGGKVTQGYKAFATIGGAKTEVTDQCTWSLADTAFGAFSGATLSVGPRGGATKVEASCAGVAGTADLVVVLTGTLVAADTPKDAPATFGAAKLGTTATRTPTIEYPLDTAIAPLNIPPIETQWTTAGNDLFHLSLSSPSVAIDYYTKAADGTLTETDWSAVALSAAGEKLTITVEGLATATPTDKFASAPISVRLSHDRIDNTAIYYWASSTGNLMTQVFGNTGTPTTVKEDCTSCHSVSRSGSRVGYSRCVAGDCGKIFVGFMHYDLDTKKWVDTVDANAMAIGGSYTTFSPVGYPYADDKKSIALVARNNSKLELFDPDTGSSLPSNVGDVSGGGTATMPDWSPDGKSVVFALTPTPGQWIDLATSSIATMSYAFDGTKHTFGTPKKIVSGTLSLLSGSYDNFFFPSFSPDGKLVVFNAARSQWRQFTVASAPGQRLMITDAAGSYKVELAKMNGSGDLNVTWPHWAPGVAADYYWVVFSSERSYGHKMNAALSPKECASNGVKSCKQIWIGAVDKTKLDGISDPSAPPVWMPGQTLAADNISPYWTLPTSSIAK